MGLNKIVGTLLEFAESLEKEYPKNKDNINILFQSIRELIDNLIYEDSIENNNRYPYYERNHKSKSIIVLSESIIEICKNDKIDKKKLFKQLIDIRTNLIWFEWYISDSKKNLNKILKKIEKDLIKENKKSKNKIKKKKN